jgi:hypothetical protein
MAFQFPHDKLDTINSALALTGDNLVNVADNGSDEWTVCSPAYETALGYIMESHSWGYAKLVKTLTPSPTAPSDTDWDTAYPLPSDLVFLLWVKINDNTSSPIPWNTSQLALYDIQANPAGGPPLLLVNAQGGPPPPNPPQTPAVLTIQYISNSGALADSTNGTPTLIASLQRFVMGGIYRGLHEDAGEADKCEAAAMRLLQEARTRYDQQKPKRRFFNSRMAASRRIRRPYPQSGTGEWGSGSGSGIPG